jgi:hypothetical protein
VSSVGLHFEGSSVLRVLGNADVADLGFRRTYHDARWDFDGHEYRLEADTRDAGDIDVDAGAVGPPPFWVDPTLAAAPERLSLVRDVYRSLEAIDRLHPPGMRRSGEWQRALPGTRGLTRAGELALVVLVRGRDRPGPAAVPQFFRDAFVDSRYEVGGAQVSVFLVQAALGRLLAWDSRIEGTTTAARLGQLVRDLVDDVVGDALGN